ncbi:cytochrome P450 [Lactarius vividus]|nr:cytochrome P450 [Lactarius vividus]
MPTSLLTAVDCLALSTFLYILFAFRDHRRRRGFPYPPGPTPLPLIGNLRDVPMRSPWVGYAKMSKKYGDIISFQVLGEVVVVLNSSKAIRDLFDKRGELYADRNPFPIFDPELLDVVWMLPMARAGNYWREGRKLIERSFRPGAPALDRRLIEERVHVYLGWLLAKPKDFREHIHYLQGGLLVRLSYGYDLKENDDMLYPPKRVGDIMKQFFAPGTALVNHFPILKRLPSWVPLFKYEPLASESRELVRRMKDEPLNFVRKSMRDGTGIPSIASEYLQDIDRLSGAEHQRAEEDIKDVLGSLFQAGADTACVLPIPTVAAMSSLFLALVLYPEVQKRAQAELDSVLSRDRLPTYEDRPRLPYIDAMTKEIMRWHIVAPLGVAHSPTEDDFYKGYFIPKGAMVIANSWGVLHDPELYPDPEAFKPERFLDKDGNFCDDPLIPLAFGAGRRHCPGRHFVDTILFVQTASMLSVFNVTKAKDKDGNEIPVSPPPYDTVLPDIAIWLPEFECSITPRDKIAEDLITATRSALS